MPISAFATGTQTATINTEHFIADVNAAGEYALHVDKNAMAAGDVLELRIYEMLLTSGTARVREFMTYYGAQPAYDLIAESPFVATDLSDSQGLRFSLKQTFGTGRSYPWKVLNKQGPVTLANVQGVRKNAALNNFEFMMYDSANAPKTGLTITAQRSIDGAAYASCANAPSEISNGLYKINLAAADLNGDVITLRFSGSGAVDTVVTLKTNSP